MLMSQLFSGVRGWSRTCSGEDAELGKQISLGFEGADHLLKRAGGAGEDPGVEALGSRRAWG
jgi:hypothetical protein